MTRASITAIFVVAAITVLSAAEAGAHPAWGIAVDRQGRVYFSDLRRIWRIDARGDLSVFRECHSHEITVDEAGNVYGEEDFTAVWRMTPGGHFSYLHPPARNPPKGVSIWRDRDGNMYSVEQNNHLRRETLLLKRTPGGNVSVLAGGSYGHADGKGAKAMFSNILGMTFGPDGSLYLVDGPSIRKVTMEGTVTTLVRRVVSENAPSDSTGGSTLFGIAVDARGNVSVADYGNRRVLKVHPDGRMTTLLRSEGPWFPTGVAARDGELYILEESHTPAHAPLATRVRRLSPDGSVRVLAIAEENGASSEKPSSAERPLGEGAGRVVERKSPYALLGVGVGAFALTFIVWRMRRKSLHS